MVKFLHTADWHIGRKLQGKDLLEDQQYVMNNLISKIPSYRDLTDEKINELIDLIKNDIEANND